MPSARRCDEQLDDDSGVSVTLDVADTVVCARLGGTRRSAGVSGVLRACASAGHSSGRRTGVNVSEVGDDVRTDDASGRNVGADLVAACARRERSTGDMGRNSTSGQLTSLMTESLLLVAVVSKRCAACSSGRRRSGSKMAGLRGCAGGSAREAGGGVARSAESRCASVCTSANGMEREPSVDGSETWLLGVAGAAVRAGLV